MQDEIQMMHSMLREMRETQMILLEKIERLENIDKQKQSCRKIVLAIPNITFSDWLKNIYIEENDVLYFHNRSFSDIFVYLLQRAAKVSCIHPIACFSDKRLIWVYKEKIWCKLTIQEEQQWIRSFHSKLLAAVCRWRDKHIELIYNNNECNDHYNKMILKLTRISLLQCSFTSLDIRKNIQAIFSVV